MKLRVLWVDDEVRFGPQVEEQQQGTWPEIFGYLLRSEAEWRSLDSGFEVNGEGGPATFLELRFAAEPMGALDLIQRQEFDLAILDVRLEAHAENKKKFLESMGITETLDNIKKRWGDSADPLVDMVTSFFLWRELVRRNQHIRVFFYTRFADAPDAFSMLPYRPFINPGCQLPLAIYGKFSRELSAAVWNYLDSRAMNILKRLPYRELEEFKRALSGANCKDEVWRLLEQSIPSMARDSDAAAKYFDIFPELALDCHFRSPDLMNECKPKVLVLFDNALACHQVCKIVARLHNARNLDWRDERPLGLELVREFQPQSTAPAWLWTSRILP